MDLLNHAAILPALLCILSKIMYVASHLAAHYLQRDGLLIFHGSYPVMKETLPRIRNCMYFVESPIYAIAETMLHGIGNYMGQSSELPPGARVLTLLPDFPLNTTVVSSSRPMAELKSEDPLLALKSSIPNVALSPPLLPSPTAKAVGNPEGETALSTMKEQKNTAKESLQPHMIADYIDMWCNTETGVPASGSFVGFKLANGTAIPELL